MTKQIEGLVSRLRAIVEKMRAADVPDALVNELEEAFEAPAVTATRSGVVDEAGLDPMWIGRDEYWAHRHAGESEASALGHALQETISAMRRVSKTDEGRNGVSDEQIEAARAVLEDHRSYPSWEVIRAALEAANLCGRNAVADEIQAAFDKGYRAAGGTITPVIFQTDSREG